MITGKTNTSDEKNDLRNIEIAYWGLIRVFLNSTLSDDEMLKKLDEYTNLTTVSAKRTLLECYWNNPPMFKAIMSSSDTQQRTSVPTAVLRFMSERSQKIFIQRYFVCSPLNTNYSLEEGYKPFQGRQKKLLRRLDDLKTAFSEFTIDEILCVRDEELRALFEVDDKFHCELKDIDIFIRIMLGEAFKSMRQYGK